MSTASTATERVRKHRKRNTDDPARKVRLFNVLLFNDISISMVIDVDSEVWFRGLDIANALEYKDPRNALSLGTKDLTGVMKYKDLSLRFDYGNVHPDTIFLSEPALYLFLIRCNMPKVESFTKWIAYNVLPSIRKYNRYETDEESNPLYNINILLRQNEELKLQVNQLKIDLAHSVAKIEHYEAEVERYVTNTEQMEIEHIVGNMTETVHHQVEIQSCENQIRYHEAMIKNLTTRQQANQEELNRANRERDMYIERVHSIRSNVLESIKPNYVPNLRNIYKKGKLVIINKGEVDEYPYYGARIQSRNYISTMNSLRRRFPFMIEIFNASTANGIALFNYIFEEIPWMEREVVGYYSTNSFKILEDRTEEEMLSAIRDIVSNPIRRNPN